jgi:type I restriction enzyme, R subunit
VTPEVASNFGHLKAHDEQLVRLGMLAERYFPEDPNTCLLKLRQLSEALAQLVASRVGLYSSPEEKQTDLLRRLQDHGILPREVSSLFHEVRKAGNDANHKLAGDHRTALMALRLTWQLSLWFHRTFDDPGYKSGAFQPPASPTGKSPDLEVELKSLRAELDTYRAAHKDATEALGDSKAKALQSEEERAFWESVAAEAEGAKHELSTRLNALQQQGIAQPAQTVAKLVDSAYTAAATLQISEADTRKLIDEQLVAAGWQTDSSQLTYAKGARPEKNRFLAIAEWPTESGPADYVLFAGFTPLAVVEAKRKNIDVSGALQQAKRYSRDIKPSPEVEMQAAGYGASGAFRVPFAFSSNARPFLRQLATKSGVWFCDLRRPENLSQPLDGWYTPEGLLALVKRDEVKAHEKLANEPFNYGFPLRDYQRLAILKAESAIKEGQRELLLAMATGTGKTKTCVALIYRLLKAERFRRILFLVDRSALGEQATNAFKDTRMENLQTFADTFGIKELEDMTPESDTSVHIATVQGMVQRLLFASDDSTPPSVDQYDCIVVDECHRGYLLDRELSDTELTFRGYDDYISKYRRVLDYFDAVKIGLTATPALHTTQIFGPPVYTYTYREAVIDGFLVDYEPPIQISTDLSASGIKWKIGDELKVFDVQRNQIQLFKAPDEIKLEVDDFNRKVITESFNRVVCDYLATELDPASQRKTLIFCVNDAHADLVVHLMKAAFKNAYGTVEDDAVMKITGAADKPLSLIRRYKNERLPNVAVTVDLLTTGIDVPKICNLVFLRRVNSRILFDQMLGRATRLCPDIEDGQDKESFRVFDAVQIFDALQGMTAMQPVVVNPTISFSQLAKELATLTNDEARSLVRDQFLVKLQRKKRHLDSDAARDFEIRAGMPPGAFIRRLRDMPPNEVAQWFTNNPELGEILDRKSGGPREPVFISDHEDRLKETSRGYGKGQKPEDYLHEFTEFIRSKSNTIPALMTVLTRPRELTRRQLRNLMMDLDKAGFTETGLTTAWREMTNQDIAARIVGYIRQAAIGDALVPYGERVDRALSNVLAHPPGGKPWSTPQRDWLKKIAAQTKANTLVDRDALDDPDLLFKTQGGGFQRLDKIFGGHLQQTLEAFNDAIWAQPSQPAA